MGKSAPKAPDPAETAGAQTANNIGTAIANQVMGNVNQVTPTGSLSYEQSGTTQWTDPNTGNVYELPSYTATQSLSDSEQGIFDSSQATRQNMADLSTLVSGQMNNHFAQPLDFGGLPDGGSASNINAPQYQGLTGLQGLSTGFAGGGPINSSVNSRAGELTRDFGSSNISAGIADAGEILREFGDAGEITRTYGTDFSEDRRRVEEALMSRLNPSLSRDKEALRTSLLNQGIREGSEAFDRAMSRANEQSTDARMQAILAGGQEQSRLADLEARRAGFENAAQQQAYNQALGRGQFSNNAQQQQFGQNRDSAALSLQAQIANEQANFARMRAGNDATMNAFGMDMGAAQFGNQAQAQQFGQNLAGAQFGNQAVMGNNALMFDAANFGNNLQDRSFANDQTMQNRMDADRQRALQETLTMRNQPINEIGALLGTGQVQMPNFVNTNGVQMPTVDRAGMEYDAYGMKMDAWQQRQAMMGNVLGIGGQVLGAGIGSGGRWA